MSSVDRRVFLRDLSTGGIAIFAGCTGRAGRTRDDRPVDSIEIRVIESVRTEGNPIRVSNGGTSETDPETILRTAISNRTNCIEDEIPISAHNSGLLVTTESIVKSLQGNTLFPSLAHRQLKQVTPRSIITTPSQTTTAEETPVYIKAILRHGESGGTIPRMRSDCQEITST